MKKFILSIVVGFVLSALAFLLFGKAMIDLSNKERYVEYSSYSEENLKVIAYGKDLDTVTIYAERSDEAIIGSIWKCDNHTYEVGKTYKFIVLDNNSIMPLECVNNWNSKLFAEAKKYFNPNEY